MSPGPRHVAAAELLGSTALLVVVHDGLDQERMRRLWDRLHGGRSVHGQTASKEDLSTELVRLALGTPRVLKLLAHELDRAAHRELALIRSIAPASLRDRVLALPALALRRERARILWALAQEPGDAARDMALELAGAIQRAVADAQAHLSSDASPEALREKVLEISDEAQGHARRVEAMQQKVERLERERAASLAQVGMRESQLRTEIQARADAERQLERAQARVRELERLVEDMRAQLARTLEPTRSAGADQAMVVRMEHLQERLRRVESEKAELQEALAAALQHDERRRDEQRELATALHARETASHERIRRLREMLRDARRARLPDRDSPTMPRSMPEGRVALHVDVANLAASAQRHHRGRVDFTSLLDGLLGGRPLARAVAYAVEQGEPARFEGFCSALRDAGYEVRVRKPRTRSDGSTKADWDMGIAMDVVEDHAHADTVILCSGDGDYVPLLQLMRRRGKRVEVAAFPADTSDDLRAVAHAFHPLDARVTWR